MLLVDDDEWCIIERRMNKDMNAKVQDWQVVLDDDADDVEFTSRPFLIKITSNESCCPAKRLKTKLQMPVKAVQLWALMIGEAIVFELKAVNKALKSVKSMFSFY